MLSRTPGHVPASISGTRIFHAPAAPGGLPVRAWAQAMRGRSTATPLRAYLTAHAGAGQRAAGSGPEWQASGDGDGMCTSMVKTAPTLDACTLGQRCFCSANRGQSSWPQSSDRATSIVTIHSAPHPDAAYHSPGSQPVPFKTRPPCPPPFSRSLRPRSPSFSFFLSFPYLLAELVVSRSIPFTSSGSHHHVRLCSSPSLSRPCRSLLRGLEGH